MPQCTSGNAGKSFNDYALGMEGVRLGVYLGNGWVTLDELSKYIEASLSPGSMDAQYWENRYKYPPQLPQ